MKAYPYRRSDISRLAMTGVSAKQAVDLVLARDAEGDMKEKLLFAYLLGKALWTLTQPWLAGGTSVWENGESWTHWRVFPRGTPDEEIAEVFGGFGHYSGPGRAFHEPSYNVRKGSRVLAKQWGGLDI